MSVCLPVSAIEIEVKENFEGDLSNWTINSKNHVEIVKEAGKNNHVLQLTPMNKRGARTDTLYKPSRSWKNISMTGRFLFPDEGDGYLGFIYHHREDKQRTDYGVLYVKSNGSYVRASPHYDGNPSWRLYEELRKDLSGQRKIRVGTWHQFKFEVVAGTASLFIDNMQRSVLDFDMFNNEFGAIGFEARPGRGEKVWIDDLQIQHANSPASSVNLKSISHDSTLTWQVQGPFSESQNKRNNVPQLKEEDWRTIEPDKRGLINTGRLTQTDSGNSNILYLRTQFQILNESDKPSWIAFSSANNLDVWFRGFFRGTVGSERFVWSDFLSNQNNPGARLSLIPKTGQNDIILTVYGDKFAAGGFFAALETPYQNL
jgi:hypothetical protein